jgi:hypothetical protein
MKFALKVCAIDENESIFLDIVRLLSAQFVFFGHLLSFSYGSEALIGGRIPIQNLGVVVFFILSGYLICRTLPKYVDFKEFFIDRFARIYVTLVPCLLVIAILDYFMKANGNFSYVSAYTFTTWIGNLFMLQDYPVLQLATSGLGLGEPLMVAVHVRRLCLPDETAQSIYRCRPRHCALRLCYRWTRPGADLILAAWRGYNLCR